MKSLGNISSVVNGGTPKTGINDYWNGDVLWITPKDMGKLQSEYVDDTSRKITRLGLSNSSAKLLPANSIILSTRAPIGHLVMNKLEMATNQGCRGIIPGERVETRFLFYFLKHNVDLLNDLGTGTTFKELSARNLAGIEVPIAPLPEQQRIVAILDETFAGIATATANAEKNLQNARELFESHLQAVFTERGAGWVEKKLGEVCENLDSKRIPITKKDRVSGKYPYYGASGIVDYVNDYIFDEDLLLVSEDGANLLARTYPIAFSVSGKMWVNNHAHVLRFEAFESQRFVEYYLNSISLDEYVSGMAQPKLNQRSLNSIATPFPTLNEQKLIVAKLDTLAAETKRLEAIYQQKLHDLADLKQAILQKAFAGELTAKRQKAVLIPFPQKIASINTTELHAGILAIAYEHHEGTKHEKLFGHVKAEKIAHMVEARVGIDLERNPFKDAAGPNDTPRLKKVEHRARKAGYFDFREKKNGPHEFHKLNGFDKLIEKTRFALAEKNQALDELINLMLPMNRYWAEIFTTLYAAWNNLLLDKKPITDEAIVYEARENWHPEKLKIPRNDFFRALTRMKKRNYIPKGKGGKVSSRDKKRNERN